MQWFRADLHIHTVLSPCGGLDMSPVNIIRQAVKERLDIIAVTDHNTTRHCKLTQEIGKRFGITVIAGAEVNTKEEIHCLTFFENIDKAEIFQQVIDSNLKIIPNNPEIFGHQLIVDEDENIIDEEERLLIAALNLSINEVAKYVDDLSGIFIPAHINRLHNSVFSQLGFLPAGLNINALEVSRMAGYSEFTDAHNELSAYSLVCNSDAHCLDRIGQSVTSYYLELPVFEEIKMALQKTNGRKTMAL
jgi:3',5'-nucleoside bisphosphate phosphatase